MPLASLRSLRVALPVALALSTLTGAPAEAQTKKASIRIVGAKASGKLKKGETAQVDPKLARYKPVFKKLTYDRYAAKGAAVKREKAKATLTFSKLPLRHKAEVSWQPAKKGTKLRVSVTITRPAKLPKKGWVKVASLTVRVADGGHFLVKCAGAYPDGDLLLLFTASKAALGKDKD